MRILLTAATEAEIAPSTEYIRRHWEPVGPQSFVYKKHILDVCIAGVGMTATGYNLTKAIAANRYQLAIQAGVAGSFYRQLTEGQLVLVASDTYGDMGAEDHEDFLDVFDLGLAEKDHAPFKNGRLLMPENDITRSVTLVRVSGLTVNKVAGSQRTITERSGKYNCQVESMEGAAFHYVCLMEKIPFLQVRAISNYVESRDKSKWKMKEAIIDLNDWLINFLMGL